MKLANFVLARANESSLGVLWQSRPWVRGFILTSLFTSLTAIAAQVSLRLPFTPVPVTGQVLMVLLAGGLLGPKLGALSQLEYLALGAAGLPIFAGYTGGLLAIAGPSGGYLFGFVAAAWVVGLLCSRQGHWLKMALGCLSGIFFIYLFGWIWLAGWLALQKSATGVWMQAFALGVTPFILVDVAKAMLAIPIIRAAGWKSPAACASNADTLK